ncbi:hypothetical protein, partial [Proteiniclasticum sp.]|uniref:hypothetical protein n=1 Tax=Proteiniclasticum sp. TaxID=2053595 RepID=UPI00289DC3C7
MKLSKRWTGIILSAVILTAAMFIPPSGGLSVESIRALSILLVTMIRKRSLIGWIFFESQIWDN